MPRSAIDDLLKSKGFNQYLKNREAETALSVAVIERLDVMAKSLSTLGEAIVKSVTAAVGRRR